MAAQALLELVDERTPVGVRPRFVDPSEIWKKPVRRREERPQHRDRRLVARGCTGVDRVLLGGRSRHGGRKR